MKVFNPLFFSLFFICYYFMACQSSKTSTTNNGAQNKTAEEQLLAKTTLDRLVTMQEGIFILYDSTIREPLIMKSGDSLMVYSKRIGDINKDGYMLYQKMYMSSVPDVPLTTDLLKFSKISRDSFRVVQYSLGEKFKNADKNTELLDEIELKSLESIQCDIIFKKIGQLEFKGKTPVCHLMFDGGSSQIFSNSFHVTTNGIRLFTTYYKKEGEKNVFASTGHCYMKK